MKPSKLEIALSLLSSGFLVLGVFSQPLGLSDGQQWIVLVLAPVCFIPLIILQRRRKKAGSTQGSAPAQVAPSTARFWLVIVLIGAVTLSGPVWLPYTGTALSFPLLIVTSVISCVFAIGVFVLSWRYWKRHA
jgi:hypothetical protein